MEAVTNAKRNTNYILHFFGNDGAAFWTMQFIQATH